MTFDHSLIITTYLFTDGNPGEVCNLQLLDNTTEYLGDPDYVYGALEIVYGLDTILNKEEWDLVDQLWIYLINAIEQAMSSSGAEFMFPDQPIQISIDSTEDIWKFSIESLSLGTNVMAMPSPIMVYRFMHSASIALEQLAIAVPKNRKLYVQYIEKARRLIDVLGEN